MPSLIDLRRRVRAVKNTEKITKAMKTVAASKLRKSQERILGARPFSQLISRVLNGLASGVDSEAHPLLASPVHSGQTAPALLFVVTADKGLCGSFNSSLIREANAFIRSSDTEVVLGLVGRRGRDFFKRRDFDIRYEEVNIFNDLQYSHGQAIAQVAIEQFTTGQVSGVYLVYNEFKSAMQQQVKIEQLLPIQRIDPNQEEEVLAEYLFEPTPDKIFESLLPRYVETQVFRALLESAAAEHAARMTAMDAATRNAGEMIDELTLYMNKVRQSKITSELIEVVSGAEAL